ncbi:MAG TPA: transglutaminase family protein [Acidobacteriaceae bacterium]|jgi:transglutaminase-like putative cysteine protease
MLIKSEFDIQFQLPQPAAMVAMLRLHPSLERRIRQGNVLVIEHLEPGVRPAYGDLIGTQEYRDSFGNRCSRFVAPAGHLRLSGTTTIDADDTAETLPVEAQQTPVEHLPPEVLRYLLPSRYCEVDRFVQIAHDLFGWMTPGWERVTAIRDWVHEKVRFDYQAARPTKSAMDVFTERVGVCRDFQHLAVTLSRCQNIPARYVTGYLGDIRWQYTGAGDFSAWYEVWLDGRWWTMDARHNEPRLGRVLMATGRDAADVAITTSFGQANLVNFYVESQEVREDGTIVPPLARELSVGAA